MSGRLHGFARVALFLAVAVAVQPAYAQEGDAKIVELAGEVEDPNTGALTLKLGGDFTTHYFFRGIIQENQGVIFQPYLDLGVSLHEGEGFLSAISANIGIWNSIHDGPTGPGVGSPGVWYEADLYAALNFTFAQDWTFSAIYTAYTSPNDRFTTVEEIALKLGFNDAAIFGDAVPFEGFTGFQPYVLVAFEMDGQADSGNPGGVVGTDKGTYLELGITPAFTLFTISNDYPVTLSFPIRAGFSLGDYFEFADSTGSIDDSSFGYADLGVMLGVPLTFMPRRYGNWELHAGVRFMILGDSTEDANGGEDFEIIGVIGISLTY